MNKEMKSGGGPGISTEAQEGKWPARAVSEQEHVARAAGRRSWESPVSALADLALAGREGNKLLP